MKKMLSFVFVFFLLASTSWQIWNINTKNLKVYYGNSPDSEICFDGKVEDYHGLCTNPKNPSGEFLTKRRMGEERYNEMFK